MPLFLYCCFPCVNVLPRFRFTLLTGIVATLIARGKHEPSYCFVTECEVCAQESGATSPGGSSAAARSNPARTVGTLPS
jgi:hypothetical protein